MTLVSCSYYHSIVACDSGEVYTFGRNDYGQVRPYPLPSFLCTGDGYVIVMMVVMVSKECSLSLSMLPAPRTSTTNPRHLILFLLLLLAHIALRDHDHHHHHHDDASWVTATRWTKKVPHLIESLRGHVVSRPGLRTIPHNGVHARDGKLFGSGKNDYGQLGLETSEGQKHMVPIMMEGVVNIIEVRCGYYHNHGAGRRGEGLWLWPQ